MQAALEFPDRDKLARLRVLVVGDIMLDEYWLGAADRVSPEAPVPVVAVTQKSFRLGGAANVAKNIMMMGPQVTLAGIIGFDSAGEAVMQLLDESTITHCLEQIEGFQTTLKLRVIGRSQHLLRLDFESAPKLKAVQGFIARYERLIREHDVLVLSDYNKGCLSACQSLIRLARDMKKPIFVDPKGPDWSQYKGATVVTPNRSELAEAIGPFEDQRKLKRKIESLQAALEIDAVLLTRSEHGMTMFYDQKATSIPADFHELVDVTGAGDTVIAVLSVLRGCGMQYSHAMAWANRAAGITVAHQGTYAPDNDQIFEKWR